MRHPRFLIVAGVILMLLGILLPFMMVIKLVESTFFLNFLSWGASVSGLAMGMIGVAMLTSYRK